MWSLASLLKRFWPAGGCSRASTAGGTRPVMFPPRPKTSFTRRELMKEYASLAIMNTVSISGRSRRFMSAICNSYS